METSKFLIEHMRKSDIYICKNKDTNLLGDNHMAYLCPCLLNNDYVVIPLFPSSESLSLELILWLCSSVHVIPDPEFMKLGSAHEV